MSDALLETVGDDADDQLAEGVEQLVRSINDRTADFARREERVQELEQLLDAQRSASTGSRRSCARPTSAPSDARPPC